MSWMQKLYETYENCQPMIGKVASEKEVPLLPICHTTNMAQIEIVIDHQGNFKRARVVPKNDARTIIPCTEKSSGGRTSGEAPHPLCDKLQYVAKDYIKYGGNKKTYNESFQKHLQEWCNSSYSHTKIKAVFVYIQKGMVIENLIKEKVLFTENGRLLEKRRADKKDKNATDIFDLLPGRINKKGEIEKWQADAFIRWEVEIPNDPCSKTWEDKTLYNRWIDYCSATKKEKSLCYVTGKKSIVANLHPAKLRHDGDKAKLISSNDWDGFTFRGRFTDTKKHNTYQTCGVGFEVTQKAHSVLRWLISRQGYRSRNSEQAIVAWATSGMEIHRLLDDPFEILGGENLTNDENDSASTAQNLAIKLRNKIAGYKANLGDTTGVVVMGLDSATQGRMAITFYRELTGSDFLRCIDHWHDTCAWIHNYRFVEDKENRKTERKYLRFVGAPAPKDIAWAAYARRLKEDGPLEVDSKVSKMTVERLLPCIIDGRKIPVDIVQSVVNHVCNRHRFKKKWEWNKTLSIACALYRKLNEKEGYDMGWDDKRKTRDYLFGGLLASADCMERFALYLSEKKHNTSAARLMQRFSDRPCSTWKVIELALTPYKARLGGRAKKYIDVIDDVMSKFDPPEDFTRDKPLSGEFLLGYHCMREKLEPKKANRRILMM